MKIQKKKFEGGVGVRGIRGGGVEGPIRGWGGGGSKVCCRSGI